MRRHSKDPARKIASKLGAEVTGEAAQRSRGAIQETLDKGAPTDDVAAIWKLVPTTVYQGETRISLGPSVCSIPGLSRGPKGFEPLTPCASYKAKSRPPPALAFPTLSPISAGTLASASYGWPCSAIIACTA